MNPRRLFSVLTVLVVFAMLLTACAPAATPAPTQPPAQPPAQPTAVPKATEAPQPTEAPKPTEAPTTAAPVTVKWWHITTKDPGLSDWQKMADDYMAAHPNVKVEITVNEVAFVGSDRYADGPVTIPYLPGLKRDVPQAELGTVMSSPLMRQSERCETAEPRLRNSFWNLAPISHPTI